MNWTLSTRKTSPRRTLQLNNKCSNINNGSQQELLSCCFCDHVSPNISKLWLLLCFLRVPLQLASPPGFHVTHIPKGNLERARLAPPWPLTSSHLNTTSVYDLPDLSSFSLLSTLFLYFRVLVFSTYTFLQFLRAQGQQ